MVAKKKAPTKAAVKAAERKAAAALAAQGPGASLPQSADIPAGMKQMGGGYAATWTPVEVGDAIHGVVSDVVKELVLNKGTKKENKTRTMEVTDMEGERFSVWESAVLISLFDAVVELGEDGIGTEIYIRFDGLGKKKPGQSPPKLFTCAMSDL